MCGSIKPAWGANWGRGESEVYEGREPDFNQARRFAFDLHRRTVLQTVQSRWIMTGKACGLIVENPPQRLWKEPVSTAHNGAGNAAADCG
jgi:hypothetical protein